MKKKIMALILASLMTVSLFGCGSKGGADTADTADTPGSEKAEEDPGNDTDSESGTKASSDIKICYSIKGKNAWLEEQGRGCIEACEKLGIPAPTIVYNEDQADAASQSQAIEDMIALEPDAIIVDPTQAEVIATVLNKAADQGIIVVETDTVGQLDMVSASVGLDEYNAAYEQAKTMCGALNEGDKAVIVAGTQGDNNAENRLKGQQDACKDAGIEVLDAQYADFSADKAGSVMEDMITRFDGEFQAVITPSDDMTLACINALRQAGILDQVKVAGYGGFQIAVDAIKEGSMYMTVGMKPYQCGYQSVEIINDIITKDEYPKEDFIDVGAEMVTAENVDSWEGF